MATIHQNGSRIGQQQCERDEREINLEGGRLASDCGAFNFQPIYLGFQRGAVKAWAGVWKSLLWRSSLTWWFRSSHWSTGPGDDFYRLCHFGNLFNP